jgi:DNA-binding response OmpR family regulator
VKVLLQEHDDVVRAMIRPMLVGAGTSVVEAKDPWGAARIAARETPDVVLLSATDVYYCGVDVPRVLAAGSPRPQVLLVGESEPRTPQAARLPVDGYLPFPFTAARLMAAIERLVAPTRGPVPVEV